MGQALILLGALLLPVAFGLGMLLWLAHLEETLPRDVERALRKPAPPPILAVPVRPRPATVTVLLPEQRPVPQALPALTTGVELSA